jgi:hypothetical protein
VFYFYFIFTLWVSCSGSFESAAVVVLQFGRRDTEEHDSLVVVLILEGVTQKSTIHWSIRNFCWKVIADWSSKRHQ